MKKFLLICGVLAMLFSMAACGKEDGRQNINAQFLQQPTKPTTAATQPTLQPQPTLQTQPPTEATQPPTVPEATTPVEDALPDPSYYAYYSRMYEAEIWDFSRFVKLGAMDGFVGLDICPGTSRSVQEAWSSEDRGGRCGGMLQELVYGGIGDLSGYGYILYDINEDGVPELFWVHADHDIVAVFTYCDSRVVMLDAYWSRYRAFVNGQYIYTAGSSGASSASYSKLMLNRNGDLEEVSGIQSIGVADDVDFYGYIYGSETKISQDEYLDRLAEYQENHADEWLRQPIHPLPELTTGVSFTVEIPRGDFPIYSGPSYDDSVTAVVEQAGVYTITELRTDAEYNTWGKLKSGAGWVDLSLWQMEQYRPPLLTVSPATAADFSDPNNYIYQPDESSAYTRSALLRVWETVTDMELLLGEPETGELLGTIDSWGPEAPLAAELDFPGDLTTYSIRFTDQTGVRRSYLLYISGRNGNLELQEYKGT